MARPPAVTAVQQGNWRVCVCTLVPSSRYPLRPVLYAVNNSGRHWIEPLWSSCLCNLRQRRRNAFAGSAQYAADAALLKDIPITERVKGQFQFQAFNVFNHPALDLQTPRGHAGVDCSTGGVITNIDSNILMRQLQFAFRVEF